MFLNDALSPNNAKSTKAPIPARPEITDYGEKKAHRGRIDWSPGSVSRFHKIFRSFLPTLNFPTCNFFLEFYPRFSVALFQMWPRAARTPAHLHFLI